MVFVPMYHIDFCLPLSFELRQDKHLDGKKNDPVEASDVEPNILIEYD
jgi:hypothetical protein